MASLRASTPSTRPQPVTIAVVLSVLIILANFAGPAFPQGSGDDKVPTFVIVLGVILGVVGIVAAVGLWLLRKWGMILTIVVAAVNLLSSAPGLPFAPNAVLRVLATLTVLVCAAIIVLVTRPEARHAYR